MKPKGFLITELNENTKKINSVNPRKNTMTRTSRSIDQMKMSSAFLVKNEKHFNEKKQSMIEYLINEETQFVDLFKCHEFYKQITYKNNNQINKDQSELAKKKFRLKNLEMRIEEEILANTHIQKQDVDKYYRKIIEDLETQIEHQQKDIDNYKNIQQNLIERSTTTREKIYNIVDLEDKNSILYEKYQLIKEHAQNSFKRQKNLLNELVDYEKKFGDYYENGLKNKKSKYKELEYQVFKVKNSTVAIQNKLEELKNKNNCLKEEIKQTKIRNIKLNDERKSIRKDHLLTKIQLLHIFSKLHFKTLDDIIILFKTESKDYNSQFAEVNYQLIKFIKLNKDIANMTQIYTQLHDKYLNLKRDIKILLRQKNLVEEKNKFDDPTFLSFVKQSNELNESNNYLAKEVHEKEKILMNFINNLKDHSSKLNKLIESLKAQPNHSISEINKDGSITMVEGVNLDFYNLEFIENFKEWNYKDVKKLLIFFNKFQFCVNYVFCLNLLNLSNVHNDSTENKFSNKTNIILMKSPDVIVKLEDNISKAMFNLENKYKILLRSDRELFMDHRNFIVEKKK